MAITVTKITKQRLVEGGWEVYGLAAFTTTDLTGTIPTKGLRRVTNWSYGLLGTADELDVIYLNDTESGGEIPVVGGVLNVIRDADGTSGRKFFFYFRGR